MPVYTYRREDGSEFDIQQKFSDDALEICPTTGQKVVRIIQSPGIIFKGSGFYITDNKGTKNGNGRANGNGAKSESSESNGSGSSESSGSESSSSDSGTKSETKAEPASKPETKSAKVSE